MTTTSYPLTINYEKECTNIDQPNPECHFEAFDVIANKRKEIDRLMQENAKYPDFGF